MVCLLFFDKKSRAFLDWMIMKYTHAKQALLYGNAETAYALGTILDEMKLPYIHVDSDEKFIHLARHRPFDICIYDHNETAFDCKETLIECIRRLTRKHTPVLLLTSSPQQDIRQFDQLPFGFFDLMTPPYFPEMVRRKAQNLLAFSFQFKRLKKEIHKRKSSEEIAQASAIKYQDLLSGLIQKLSVISPYEKVTANEPIELEML